MLNNLELFAFIVFVHIFIISGKTTKKFASQCDIVFFLFFLLSDNADVALVNFYADW